MAQFTDEWLVSTVEPLLPADAIESARQVEAKEPVSLWELLTERKLLTDDQIQAAVSRRFHVPLADVDDVDPAVREEVPESLVRKFNILPLRLTDSSLAVATSNPFDMDAEKMLAFATGRVVQMQLATPAKIRSRLDDLYHKEREDAVTQLLEGMAGQAEVTELADEEEEQVSVEEATRRPIIRLVDTMIADGVSSRASDIHIEPVEGGVVVRYRIDGVLRQVMRMPRAAGLPLISRIKVMGGMDIADRLRPQDGRARVAVNGTPVDLRISTLPAALGEKVVLRVLSSSATVLSLDLLGYEQHDTDLIKQLLRSKEGVVLVTGPTGSGKTTTLYSCLRMVQSEGVNIVTVEDPVEYRLGGTIVQVQVNEKAGLTFAAALRSILRQDPDVVLVGEIRDRETAQIAVQAALTGHLVLSTLHTNDAPNTITRLLDMGMESYKISSAVRGIVAQRLLRRLCPVCKVPSDEPPPPYLVPYMPAGVTPYKPVGCKECSMTGYRGRMAIAEILVMNRDLEALVSEGAPADQIAAMARANGMRSLFESAMHHMAEGRTSVDEVLRVTDVPRVNVPGGGMSPDAAREAVLEDDEFGFELLDDLASTNGERKGTILLVEDEDPLRRVMKDLLEREGYTVVEAADGVEALEQVDRHAPDLLLLDLNLPRLDGYGVLAQLRSRPKTEQLPVIVLTAKGDEDNEVRVLELGANDFLTKPFRARALSARLEALLARRRPPA